MPRPKFQWPSAAEVLSGSPAERPLEYRGVPLMRTHSLFSLFEAAQLRSSGCGSSDPHDPNAEPGELPDSVPKELSSRRSRLASMMAGEDANRYRLAAQLVQDAIEGRSPSLIK